MVESAMEFARLARDLDFHDFIFSMKASNPKVMIAAYRLLVSRLYRAGSDWWYPLHLGGTEAGDGEDGRIKSAIGIGSLLADGLGDTVRVSLTEDSVHEIPVAQALVEPYNRTAAQMAHIDPIELSFDPFQYNRRPTEKITLRDVRAGGDELIRVGIRQKSFDQIAPKVDRMGDFKPEFVAERRGEFVSNCPRDDSARSCIELSDTPRVGAECD